MTITLEDDARQFIARFEDVSGISGQDCLVFEDRLVIVVPAGTMGQAVGARGQHVQQFERRTGRSVRLVEGSSDPEAFVANALAPAAIRNVTISENDTTVAYVEVPEDDRGVAIGTGGQRIEDARTLANRHFGIDDVQLA
ncbi:NusA-like transcription termination signal-binding factor [Natronosalvus halobius]|uniref:NusA-like transcription termination signal-binding factor n=1 Tax=Natronosalvus halobius TaxID=2953746 RepID=UPI00209D9A94|nr:NusA-like transcription termination signal-binding factor [Natronosalvus halobius]USZ71368.1 NusA-like transcription termination signal-binding factor [Natronosalvus halobius]